MAKKILITPHGTAIGFRLYPTAPVVIDGSPVVLTQPAVMIPEDSTHFFTAAHLQLIDDGRVAWEEIAAAPRPHESDAEFKVRLVKKYDSWKTRMDRMVQKMADDAARAGWVEE